MDQCYVPLKLMFTNILSTGVYPELWKFANVTPIRKTSCSKQLITNYWPISLFPICGKLLEIIIFKHLYTYLVSNDLITKNQSGFRPGDSTIFTRPCGFLDLAKAFDEDWYEGLIFKFKQNGISASILKLLKNYSLNRKQRVVLNGSTSDISSIETGVPQGSALVPL